MRASGLKIDVAPVLYEGEPDDCGYLITRDGRRVLTSVTLHLRFLNSRSSTAGGEYKEFIRLMKAFIKQAKFDDESFKFKPFLAELIVAHLWDHGWNGEALAIKNYPRAFEQFFGYIVRTGLQDDIVFHDYYAASEVPSSNDAIRIWDPVNPTNNVASAYTESDRLRLVRRAGEALDQITWAATAQDERRGQRYVAIHLWTDLPGSVTMTYSLTRSASFTITDARHVASKVGADLRNLNSVYGAPTLGSIDDYVEEVAQLLKARYLNTVDYGFKSNDGWKLRLRYTATIGGQLRDDTPGRLPYDAPVNGLPFYSYLRSNFRIPRPWVRPSNARSRRPCRSSARGLKSLAWEAGATERPPPTPATVRASAAKCGLPSPDPTPAHRKPERTPYSVREEHR